MPKQKITKEMVIAAAFELARSGGMEQVMVKNIAQRLNCSVQPIYSYCKNMEDLRQEIMKKVRHFIQEYVAERIDKNDLFRSTGKAYVQIAREEPYIFKMFILHQRNEVASLDDLYEYETNPQIAGFIAEQLNISVSTAKQFHLNMLIYTIGIGTIFSVANPGISADEIFTQQETAYKAFLRQALNEGEEKNDE